MPQRAHVVGRVVLCLLTTVLAIGLKVWNRDDRDDAGLNAEVYSVPSPSTRQLGSGSITVTSTVERAVGGTAVVLLIDLPWGQRNRVSVVSNGQRSAAAEASTRPALSPAVFEPAANEQQIRATIPDVSRDWTHLGLLVSAPGRVSCVVDHARPGHEYVCSLPAAGELRLTLRPEAESTRVHVRRLHEDVDSSPNSSISATLSSSRAVALLSVQPGVYVIEESEATEAAGAVVRTSQVSISAGLSSAFSVGGSGGAD